MNSLRRAAVAATTLALAVGGATAVAHADGPYTIYVDSSASTCTDSGYGTEKAPFCTIQAAVNWTSGVTVDVEGGDYTGPLTITSHDQLDTIEGNGATILSPTSGATGDNLILDGASDVSISGLTISGTLVENSSNVSLSNLQSSFEVTGSSKNVGLSGNTVTGAGGVAVDAGSSEDVISGNLLTNGSGISVDDVSNTYVTWNTVLGGPADGAISVSGASTGTKVENNITAYRGSNTGAEIAVDSDAAAGTTEDYNVVWPNGSAASGTAYSWAGTDYSTQSAFSQATGQGAHDLVADPEITTGGETLDTDAPQINSGNSAILGGANCTQDPAVPVTGAGTPAYCTRGADQLVFGATVQASATPAAALGVDLSSALSQKVEVANSGVYKQATPEPTPAISYAIAWGDGDSQTVQASSATAATSTAHTYAKAGTYTITDTANLTNGKTTSTTTSLTVGSDYTAYGPSRILDTRKGTGATKAPVKTGGYIKVKIAGVGSIPANVTAVALNLTATDTTANGYLDAVPDGAGVTGSNLNYLKGQTVANSAIVPVAADGSIDIYNEGNSGGTADVIGDVSGYFSETTASGYTPVTEDRILDTRKGTGAPKAKVAAGADVPVTIAGVDSIPSGVTAVAVHVTVTDTTGNGWVAAEPDGAGKPTTSNLNYLAGQTESNTVIVPVAADGKIELYNGGESGSVDLIADVTGYFAADGADAYVPITPFRAWDSRKNGGELTPDGTNFYSLADIPTGSDQSVFPAGATLATNLTVTDVTANGFIAAYPDGTARPTVSNLNYLKGQTVAGLGLLATTGSAQTIDVYNNSTGTGDLIADVFGYFAKS